MAPKPVSFKNSVYLQIPPYEQHLYFFTTREDWVAAHKKVGADCEGHESAAGISTWIVSDTHIKIFLVGVFNNDPGTLVHEICHFVLDLFDHVGINVNGEESEAFAYMMGFTYSALISKIKPKRKKAVNGSKHKQASRKVRKVCRRVL